MAAGQGSPARGQEEVRVPTGAAAANPMWCPAPQLLSCLTEEKWGCAQGTCSNWSPGLPGEAGIMAAFVKIGIRKKSQNLFSRAEVLGTAEGHREELSCAHTYLFLFNGLCHSRGQL